MKFSLQWLDHRPAPVGSRFTAPATLRVAIRAGRDFPWRISPKKTPKRAVAMNRDPTDGFIPVLVRSLKIKRDSQILEHLFVL
jgi:hypothetical protein